MCSEQDKIDNETVNQVSTPYAANQWQQTVQKLWQYTTDKPTRTTEMLSSPKHDQPPQQAP